MLVKTIQWRKTRVIRGTLKLIQGKKINRFDLQDYSEDQILAN